MMAIKQLIFTTCLVLISFTLIGQNKQIKETDFDKWYDIVQRDITTDGQWIAHVRSNEPTKMFLLNLINNKEIYFEDVLQFQFAPNNQFIFVRCTETSFLFNLKTSKKTKYKNVVLFQWLTTDNTIVLQYKDSMEIVNTNRLTSTKFEDVVASYLQKQQEWILLKKNSLETVSWFVFDFETGVEAEIQGLSSDLENIRLDDKTKSFIGISKSENKQIDIEIAYYDNSKWMVESLVNSFPNVFIFGNILFIDGEKGLVYFYTVKENISVNEVNKNIIVKKTLQTQEPETLTLFNCWNYKTNEIFTLQNDSMDEVLVTSLGDYFIGYSTKNYDIRDNRGIKRADFYLIKVNQTPEVIEKDIVLLNKHFIIHSTKPYVVYFKEGHWWSYHIQTKKKSCLTNGFKNHFFNFDKEALSKSDHYDVLGFSKNKEEIIIYDEFDVWKLDLNGDYILKCTEGRIDNLTARYALDTRLGINQFTQFLFNVPLIDTSELILKQRNKMNFETSLIRIDQFGKKTTIMPATLHRILNVKKLESQKYLILKENHQTPPKYEVYDQKGKMLAKYQTNTQYLQYKWGSTKLFNIKLKDGYMTQASLIYPFDWDPAKKYPMVVYYYENTAHYAMYYTPPSYKNVDGINSTLFSKNGFFVLYLDMRYKDMEVTKYLVSDTDEILDYVLKNEPTIHKEKLGMMGHSFGGFEVMYLSAKTNRYKAAVAGAGVSDLIDFYYTEKDKGSLGMFAAENVQLKMLPPYLNTKCSITSPLDNIANVNIPMLFWTGENDDQVSQEHSIKMYLGLWRQKKEAELVIYKNEGHSLVQPENMKDLTKRIIEFFKLHLNKA